MSWDFWINTSCWLHPHYSWDRRQLCPSLGLIHLAGWAAAWRYAHGCPSYLGFVPGYPAGPGACVPASSSAVLASMDTSTVLKSHLHLLSKHTLRAKEDKFFSEQRSSLLFSRAAKLNSSRWWLTHCFSQTAKVGYKTTSKTQSPKPGVAASSCCLVLQPWDAFYSLLFNSVQGWLGQC